MERDPWGSTQKNNPHTNFISPIKSFVRTHVVLSSMRTSNMVKDIHCSASMAEKSVKNVDQVNQQKIIENFQKLRGDQRTIVNKITELESERSEHT